MNPYDKLGIHFVNDGDVLKIDKNRRLSFFKTNHSQGSLGLSIFKRSSNQSFINYITYTGSALIMANASSMITDVFPPNEIGKALGINVAFLYLGLVLGSVLGSVLGGLLVQGISLRVIFAINLPIAIIIIIMGLLKIKKTEVSLKDESVDIIGTLFFGIFLADLTILYC